MVEVCSGNRPNNPSSRRSFSGKAVLRFSSGSSSRRWPLIEVAWVSHSGDVSAVMVEFILLSFSFVSQKKPGQDAGGGGRETASHTCPLLLQSASYYFSRAG